MNIKFVILFFLLSVSNTVYGNSCAFPNVEELDRSRDIVFIGRVNKKLKDFSLSSNKYSIEVIESYKGDVSGIMTVWTLSLSSCGIDFSAGEVYVIFGKINKNKIFTSISSAWIMSESNQYLTNQFKDFYKNI